MSSRRWPSLGPGASACAACAPTPRASHAELDDASELDDGDPEELGGEYLALHALLPQMNVVGGCCGTDERHVAAIARYMCRGK